MKTGFKKLNEIAELIINRNYDPNDPDPRRERINPIRTPSGPGGRLGIGVNIKSCSNLYPWQMEITNTLLHGNDVYVVAAPGAGKTMPIMCYWGQRCLNLNPLLLPPDINNPQADIDRVFNQGVYRLLFDPKSIPKLLITCPVRTLVDSHLEDFTNEFSRILLQCINILFQREGEVSDIATHRTTRVFNNANIRNFYQRLTYSNPQLNLMNAIDERQRLAEKINLVRTNPADPRFQYDDINRLEEQLINIDAGIINNTGKALNNYISSNLIVGKTGAGQVGVRNIEDAPVVITIYESAKSVFDKIKDNLNLIVFDEAHKLQDLPDRLDDRTGNICRSLYYILENMTVSTRIAFLSGTVNPSAAKDLKDYIQTCYRKNIHVMDNSDQGNKAKFEVIPNDSIRNEDNLVNIVINSNSEANLIVLFSKKKINSLVEKAINKKGIGQSIQNVQQGAYQKYSPNKFNPYSDKYDRRYSTSRLPDTQVPLPDASTLEAMRQKRIDINDISNPMQLKAIQCGFGFIYRTDRDDDGRILPQDEQEKYVKEQKVVASLFREGKIKTLISTDAVGIGINISVKNVYIPISRKFDSSAKGNVSLPVSDLSQLLNRAGRSDYPHVAVHTPQEYVEDILEALSATTSNFETRKTQEGGLFPNRLNCRAFNVLQRIWNRANGIQNN